MKRVGLFLLAVGLVAIAGCGGGGGGSDSDEFDPTGSEWQFLVSTADTGDTMYTLTFFDSTGAKAASGLFTAVSAGGASYNGTWTSEGYVVTGVSSGAFAFTLNVNTDTTTGTIDYVTTEGSGSSAATRTDSPGRCQYTGNWAGTVNQTRCGETATDYWTATVSAECIFMMPTEEGMFGVEIRDGSLKATVGGCNHTGTAEVSMTFSGNTMSGTIVYSEGRGSGTIQGTRQ